MSYLLETRNLEKTFGAVIAASNINAGIKQGETVGIIGSNGAGKTTFVNMITGYLEPSNGQIFFKGKDITGLQSRYISRLGICRSFQIPQLFPELSVLENILLAIIVAEEGQPRLTNRAITPARIEKANAILDRFSIKSFAEQNAGTIPQGIKKLLDIAMATAGKTDIVMLDEPTSGVSSDEKMDMMRDLFKALKMTDTTILFIEHDMEIIQKFAERVIAFYEGQVLDDGPTVTVLNNAKVREYIIGYQAAAMEKSAC